MAQLLESWVPWWRQVHGELVAARDPAPAVMKHAGKPVGTGVRDLALAGTFPSTWLQVHEDQPQQGPLLAPSHGHEMASPVWGLS